MDVVFSIAQKIAVLHQGRLIAEGHAGGSAREPGGAARLSRGATLSLLDVHDIHAAYGSSRVLFGISLEVARGECVCLLGRNGVGKTTTMRAIMGLTPPSSGRIVWKGRTSPGCRRIASRALGIGFVPEDRRIFAELTVLGEPRRRGARRRPSRPLDHRCGVRPVPQAAGSLPNRQGGFLSGGEQQMLTIGRTLMGNPDLLLLDEPSEGLAPLVVENLLEQVSRLKREGLTILLAEQGVDFSLALADRVYVLEKGAVRFSGAAAELRDNPRLRDELLALSPPIINQGRKPMPFVNIQILKGHPQERKDEIARRVMAAISELAQLPPEAIWVVFDELPATDWYVGNTRVDVLKKQAAKK